MVRVPELELELSSGTLGSRYTTIEGLLDQIHDEIKANPFLTGDAARNRHAFDGFLARLKQVGRLAQRERESCICTHTHTHTKAHKGTSVLLPQSG
jgi:C4-type Zn-finger protein